MKPVEKLRLIADIGKELQSRMTFSEIASYFQLYGIPTDHQPSYNSKNVYVKEILPQVSDEIVIEIANELEITHDFQSKLPVFKDNSTSFWKAGHFRLFISHLSSFKATIGILKNALEKYGISGFVAHEDIEPTKEWQEEIEKGLFSMDALCAVLMPGFKDSNWTDQEVGVAVGRGVLVIPIRKGLDPYGFIGKYQGFQSSGKNIEEVAEGVFKILAKNPKTRTIILNHLIDLFLLSNTQKEALERIRSIKKISDIPSERVHHLRKQITENKNLKDVEVLNEFNELMPQFNLNIIAAKDFEKVVIEDVDDLPF